jgi:hypothetical protein
MKQHNAVLAILAALAIAVIGVFGGAFMAPANAAPPTVTPSPGYDARLQEQRAAPTVYAPVVPAPKRVSRRHVKRSHDGAH